MKDHRISVDFTEKEYLMLEKLAERRGHPIKKMAEIILSVHITLRYKQIKWPEGGLETHSKRKG